LKRFILMTLLIAAIGVTSINQQATQAQSEGDSTLTRVQADGVVRVGIRFDNPPFSFITAEGNWVGFDVDLANEVAARLGVDIEQVRVDETTRISFLQDGSVDMSVASMNHTRKREEAVDFSLTYFWDQQTFLVRTGELDSLDDLFGRVVAMNAGSSAIDAWNRYVEANGGDPSEIVEFTDKAAAVQALRDGAVDGYAEDGITLRAFAVGDESLITLEGGFNPVQFGIGLPENDSEWRDAINYILQDIWMDGTYAAIYDLWFGPEAAVQLPLGGQMELWR
jgi:polar amino acid transport system substrate-binding protein